MQLLCLMNNRMKENKVAKTSSLYMLFFWLIAYLVSPCQGVLVHHLHLAHIFGENSNVATNATNVPKKNNERERNKMQQMNKKSVDQILDNH